MGAGGGGGSLTGRTAPGVSSSPPPIPPPCPNPPPGIWRRRCPWPALTWPRSCASTVSRQLGLASLQAGQDQLGLESVSGARRPRHPAPLGAGAVRLCVLLVGGTRHPDAAPGGAPGLQRWAVHRAGGRSAPVAAVTPPVRPWRSRAAGTAAGARVAENCLDARRRRWDCLERPASTARAARVVGLAHGYANPLTLDDSSLDLSTKYR